MPELGVSTRTRILALVKAQTDRPFAEELADLLTERGLSQRKLAQLIDLNPSHISRVLRGANRTRPSIDLISRVARALDLPTGYFKELREAAVIEKVKTDPKLRDILYEELEVERGSRASRRKGRRLE